MVEKKDFLLYVNLLEEKVSVLVFETVTKFLPSVRLKSGNNLGHDLAYKTDVPDDLTLTDYNSY